MGLITDGTYNYNMDTTDGHYLGQFQHVHNLAAATCTEGSICLDCGLNVSGALGHNWNDNCYCERCGEYEYKMYFDGIKTYDYKGSNNSVSSYFNCKLYKGDTVVASTMIGTPLLMEGEYFEDESAYFWSLPPRNYTIKLLDSILLYENV